MKIVPNEDWTAHVVGQMHKYKISNRELAARCFDPTTRKRGYSPAYLSTVLNGHKELSEAGEAKTRSIILAALEDIISEREVVCHGSVVKAE